MPEPHALTGSSPRPSREVSLLLLPHLLLSSSLRSDLYSAACPLDAARHRRRRRRSRRRRDVDVTLDEETSRHFPRMTAVPRVTFFHRLPG